MLNSSVREEYVATLTPGLVAFSMCAIAVEPVRVLNFLCTLNGAWQLYCCQRPYQSLTDMGVVGDVFKPALDAMNVVYKTKVKCRAWTADMD